MNDELDELFDEKKIKKAVRKGKRKSILTIIVVSVLVFIGLIIANFAVSAYFSQKAFKQWDAYVRLSTPNGYISETVDSTGILGGMGTYKVSKDMKIKPVVIEQKQYQFGLIPSVLISRGRGGSIGTTGEDWQFAYKENGWRELLFFHPSVTYKEYKHDDELISNMPGDKIFEVALSFDQPYQPSELPFMELPELTWFWLNTYSDTQINEFQQEAKENDWSSTFIRESNALGFSINDRYFSANDLAYDYEEFLKLLKASGFQEHTDAYDRMKDRKIEEAEILGVVVYGTKEEIADLIDKPFVTAVSLGGVIDNY
ncbi:MULTISPECIES: anti sigma factor C-terminal domain-containing protein [unclassified Sporosarcina]|uniref:anti sigma factor C-terminal domain-containing protein n=1 Tax=unclassified Sporosarcina TaxID=2647733 RepID=UPI00203D3B58|nr:MULTISPECIES: anti sigma factor C-terminal domain-containing protein [unclassified Sporosarcina]GKV65138.1 hypothetical protein NCCP2331_12910 [Sporosarcina sp. NCCP-2331]GLB55262.1 hypothetical protein NCCP2378_10480 [Sporosarcina sp. NCCP-2378]